MDAERIRCSECDYVGEVDAFEVGGVDLDDGDLLASEGRDGWSAHESELDPIERLFCPACGLLVAIQRLCKEQTNG